ncbi:hypothetical protein HPB51_004795 [Rhipicephalus microplus]|uniref:Uncharacterized protein n=1 Tax=Rhipicephalus microplus TaxID=6941 RepID=A0A9J6E658_RHIMP|nr:hypothetical protein HPB51_004795 [Rhipicephalus microplus]
MTSLRQATAVLAVTVETCGRVGDPSQEILRACWAGLLVFSGVTDRRFGHRPHSESDRPSDCRVVYGSAPRRRGNSRRHSDTSDHLDDSDVYIERYKKCHNTSLETYGCAPPDQLYKDAEKFFEFLTHKFMDKCRGDNKAGNVALVSLLTDKDGEQTHRLAIMYGASDAENSCDGYNFIGHFFRCSNYFMNATRSLPGHQAHLQPRVNRVNVRCEVSTTNDQIPDVRERPSRTDAFARFHRVSIDLLATPLLKTCPMCSGVSCSTLGLLSFVLQMLNC